MAVGLALLISADPVAIQQFSQALEELSISPNSCRDVPAAIGLREAAFRAVNPQYFKARIWAHSERAAALLSLSGIHSCHYPAGKQAGSPMHER